MLYSTYNFMCFIVGFAVLMATHNTEASFVLGTAALGCFAAFFSISVLIFPKMYIHLTGKVLNVQAMFGVRNNVSSNDEERSVSVPSTSHRTGGRGTARVWDSSSGHNNQPYSSVSASQSIDTTTENSAAVVREEQSMDSIPSLPSSLPPSYTADQVTSFSVEEDSDGGKDVALFAAQPGRTLASSRSKPGALTIIEEMPRET